jgi:hypothetical protein
MFYNINLFNKSIDFTQDSTEATQKACGFRWKIKREGRC